MPITMKHALLSVTPFALVATLLSSGSQPAAQTQTVEFPKASPSALARDQVGLTTVEVEYARPGVKGRKVFGGLVPYGEVWRTGANAATKVTFSTDVKFGGKPVPAGSYELFTIPGADEWTVILSKAAGQWGSYAYDPKNDLLRVTAKPTTLAEPVETLTIGLSYLRDESARFTITWDRTRVAVPIQTDVVSMLVPQIEAVMVSDTTEKPYLAAAMFYYEHDLDLAKAGDWIEAALMQQPEAVWIQYRKGLILAKAGDKAGAKAAAERALELAGKAGGSLGDEYKRLSETLLASL